MKRLGRRRATALAGAAVAALGAPAVRAKSTQPIFIIVPYGGGGSIDGIIRVVAQGMSEALEQPVLVDNKPGGNGIIGSQIVARAAKDGLTLLAGGPGPLSLNALLRKNLPYKLEDFAPVAMLFNGPLTLTIGAQLPPTDVKSFVNYARGRQKPLFYATLGPGSVTHLFGILMGKTMGITLSDVAYRNNPAAIMDILAGQCDISFATPSAVMGQARDGKLRILAVATKDRVHQLPDVPSLAEAGYPALTASFWTGLLAPAGTPREDIARLNAAANKAMQNPQLAKQLDVEALQITTGAPALLNEQLAQDLALWGPVIKSENISLE
jgi:tripartite-type tricarboxylate transporter receptor subunit TctC